MIERDIRLVTSRGNPTTNSTTFIEDPDSESGSTKLASAAQSPNPGTNYCNAFLRVAIFIIKLSGYCQKQRLCFLPVMRCIDDTTAVPVDHGQP
ncbi:MAG: hypothetical protein RLO18_14280 [Gimesia chilikensis]